jgi:heme oxygenase
MLSQTLKERTLTAHHELEKKLVAKMRDLGSLADYAKLLQLFHTYFGGLEQLIAAFVDETILPDYAARRKSTAIVEDLITLEAPVPPVTTDLPEVNNTAQALGALYVMEGSTLGGRHIRKMLARQLHMGEDHATSFFGGYGEDTERMWQEFKSALDRLSSPAADPVIVESANQTFRTFSRLFDNYYQNNSWS